MKLRSIKLSFVLTVHAMPQQVAGVQPNALHAYWDED